MATTYKTPGVYIEEIPKFPPSVAPVDTAIPAFIGYTEKANDEVADDLHLKPKRIESLVEFEQYFGGPAARDRDRRHDRRDDGGRTRQASRVTATAALDEADRSKHILYYALQLFYANGGGALLHRLGRQVQGAWATPSSLDRAPGRRSTPLSKVDEPTLIVVPEAPAPRHRRLQDAARRRRSQQCNDLQDRFVIMDVHGDDESLSDPDSDLLDAVANFRDDGVGTNNLKYGAAYAPNLETVLDFAVRRVADRRAAARSTARRSGGQMLADHRGHATTSSTNGPRRRSADLPLKLPPSAAMAGIYAAGRQRAGACGRRPPTCRSTP